MAAMAFASFHMYNNPDESRDFILGRLNDLNNLRDATIELADWGNDGCALDFCISTAGYLKNKISEVPLDSTAAKSLPSFTGEEYTASPFHFQI